MRHYLHTLIKNLSSSCMITVDLPSFYMINFEDPLRQFCKKRACDGSYSLSKLEIPRAPYRLVLFLRHGRIFLKNRSREF